MKSFVILSATLFTLLTAVEPIWAADDATVSTKADEEAAPLRLGDLGMAVNPQIGVSSFEYSGHATGAQQKPTVGATFEFGGPMRKLETGVLLMQTSSEAVMNDGSTSRINSTYLALPMMAKIRIVALPEQAWYFKIGAMTALQTQSSNRDVTNGADILASTGLGGRFVATKKSDFIVEATYNRGLLEALSTANGTSYNQGFVVMAGLSFRL